MTKQVSPEGLGEGFMIIVGEKESALKPEELVTVDGRQYMVAAVSGALVEDVPLPLDGEWTFDFNQGDALGVRLDYLRHDPAAQDELRARLKLCEVYAKATVAGK
jgi:hypothetical protein